MENQTPISGTSYLLELAGQTLAVLQAENQKLREELQRLHAEKAESNGKADLVTVDASPAE